jgi:uncharacterized protein (DUF1778 family)
MAGQRKSAQLQIRVTRSEKAAILAAAKAAGMDMSRYVLERVFPPAAGRFQEAVVAAARTQKSFALAELNSLLAALPAAELRDAVATLPPTALSPFLANYVAAMVEYACARRDIAPPGWTRNITPLREPVFATSLLSLRLHLLTHSPPPFRHRNIFIDSSIGARV